MEIRAKTTKVDSEIGAFDLELELRDEDGRHVGDLFIHEAGVTWCRGRTWRENGRAVPWQRFIDEIGMD